jgi:hypothetical protein
MLDVNVRRQPRAPENNPRIASSAPKSGQTEIPEEFRAPKAYESLGGTNPRWADLCLWGFGILADAGSSAAIAAACPTTCFVPASVRGMPVLGATMITDSERWGVADGIGHDVG